MGRWTKRGISSDSRRAGGKIMGGRPSVLPSAQRCTRIWPSRTMSAKIAIRLCNTCVLRLSPHRFWRQEVRCSHSRGLLPRSAWHREPRGPDHQRARSERRAAHSGCCNLAAHTYYGIRRQGPKHVATDLPAHGDQNPVTRVRARRDHPVNDRPVLLGSFLFSFESRFAWRATSTSSRRPTYSLERIGDKLSDFVF